MASLKTLAELADAPVTSLRSAARPLRSPAGVPRSSAKAANAKGGKGVKPAREAGPPKTLADALEEMGVQSIADLLTHYPRRYLDRTTQVPISDIKEGEDATVLAIVRRVQRLPARRGGRPVVTVDVWDGASYLKLSFFNQVWRANQLHEGMEVAVSGRVSKFRGRHQMSNPSVEVVEGDWVGRVVPIYPQSEKAGVSSMEIANCIGEALRWVGQLEDPVPSQALKEHDFAGRNWSMWQVHKPESMRAKDMARRRLGFDELLRLQLVLVMRKRALERECQGIAHNVGAPLIDRFRESLPFPLTGAQKRAVREIEADLSKPVPMHRLLQGDVGAGKTLVALWCLLTAVAGGHQGALMAPTEVLAEQHRMSLTAMLAGLSLPDSGSLWGERPVRVELLTNRTTGADRALLLGGLANGEVDIVVGTHALLTESVRFAGLGMVVIDEQHRFGVEQRAALRGKASGPVPDVLVMTATPIPRTAAMTVYGDLDTTVLDELPPGRTPVRTSWARGPLEAESAWRVVKSEVEKGHQAYVVCPLVEESEKVQAASASEELARLAAGPLVGLSHGLLHGQLPAKEKEQVMADFRAARTSVLVATTVIEVGVDVPNATVMVIEDADRFGIAQLHQLRGRVGRGAEVSYCFLLGDATTPEGTERLAALERTTDGFELAEIDLDLRGEGTILGTRQKGVNDLKLASLRRHRKYVALAREVAFEIIDDDPHLARHPALANELRALVDDEDREYLFKN
ncbi:MAG TPA: ATP-dependent DNA helicase RecG [Acidimicrobiales bacterium]|nr:ATP-dependent DNA helicase RecG [Acidimicrobiales bacterium]